MRHLKVKINGVPSEVFPQLEGVPKGSVLSTIYPFYYIINDLVKQLLTGVQCIWKILPSGLSSWMFMQDKLHCKFITSLYHGQLHIIFTNERSNQRWGYYILGQSILVFIPNSLGSASTSK